MNITFENIYDHLKDDIINCIYADEKINIQLNQVKLIVKNQEKFEVNTVYVGTSSFIYKNNINLKGANLILIDDLEESLDISLNNVNYYIGLNAECDLFKEFNRINNIFNDYMKLGTIKEYDNIKQVAYKASELLENPVIFIDSSYKVLAHSSSKPIIDGVWKENVERGYCSYEFISYVRNMQDMKNSLNDSTPFPLNCYKSDIEKYASKFFIRGRLMGYMVVLLEDKEFNNIKKELAMEISKIAASCYKRSMTSTNFEDLGYENLLMDLLDNKITDIKTLDEKIKIYDESFKSQMVILILDISKFGSKNNPAGYISRELDTLLNKRHIYYENKIVVLYDFEDERFTSINQIKRLKKFAQVNNITIGVSNVFSELILSRKHYLEAKKVINLKNSVKLPRHLTQYKDVAFYVLLDKVEKHNIDLNEYVHPNLEILRGYDEKNQMDLYTTLYTYLKNNQNAVLTGEDLFLHRNTVKYRMDKIIEITGLDLSDEGQVFNMLFSYKLNAFKKGS